MGYPIKRGATSQIILFKAYDTTSVIGAGKTGLTTSSFTSAYFTRSLANTATLITLDGTMVAGTWKTGGFIELDATHLPGWYAISLPNAAVGSGDASPECVVVFVPTVAAGAYVGEIHIPLVAYDPQDSVALGLTDIDATISSRSTYAGGAVGSVTAAVTVGTNNDKAGYSLATPPPTASQNAVAVVDQALSGHTTAGTVGGQLNEIGASSDPWATNLATGGYAVPQAGAEVLAIKAKTDTIGAGALPVVNPVVNAQTVVISEGDDYLAADGRAIDLVYSGLPDFTAGTDVLLTVTSRRLATIVTWAGTVLNPTTLRFQPTHSQTVGFEIGGALSGLFAFKSQITLADGSVISPTPLESGKITVNALPG